MSKDQNTIGNATAQRSELHRKIWAIADDVRGAVDGQDFKQYILGILFYRFISENITEYFNIAEREAEDTDFDYASNAGKSGGEFFTPHTVSKLLVRLVMDGKTSINKVYDPTCGFRVIIMTQPNSQVNTRGLELLLNSKSKK